LQPVSGLGLTIRILFLRARWDAGHHINTMSVWFN
jgi:hypothetical protein